MKEEFNRLNWIKKNKNALKILNFIIDNPRKEWNSKTIADNLNMSQSTATKYLQHLSYAKLIRQGSKIQRNRFGGFNTIYYKDPSCLLLEL